MYKKFAGIAVAISLIAACATTDPNTGEKKVSNTSKDAGIGALAGAVIGAVTSNKSGRAKGVLTGAALGGAAGAGYGYYTDKQEAKLKEKLANSGVNVKREGQNLNLVMPGAISFNTGSAQLRPDFYTALSQVAASLYEFPDSTVQITGHTDSTGAAANNQQLSLNRANAVLAYLGGRGINPQRIQALGMGSSQPIADNATAEGRAQNRRVELKIIPNQQQANN